MHVVVEKFYQQYEEGKGGKSFLFQPFAGISGFQRQPEPWFFKVRRYCFILQLLVLNLKMMDSTLVIIGKE